MKTKDFLARWYKVSEVTMPPYFDGTRRQPGYTDLHVIRPRVVCKDGFSISIQASKHRCCEPAGNKFDGTYTKVELLYPSSSDSLINEYALDKKSLTEAVYPYVPISVVDKLMAKHGGIKGPDPDSLSQLSKCTSSKIMKQKISW